MSKTMADHARAYRERKAAKLARLERYEAALREIASTVRGFDNIYPQEVARNALNAEAEA